MTDTPEDLKELVDDEAERMATGLYELVASHVYQGFDDANQIIHGEREQDTDQVLLPALMWRIYEKLAAKLKEGADGFLTILEANIRKND